MFVPNHNTNAGPVTVWLQVCYMHLCCAYVPPWSVCARSAQHWAPAASHTRAGHKGGNPYTKVCSLTKVTTQLTQSIYEFTLCKQSKPIITSWCSCSTTVNQECIFSLTLFAVYNTALFIASNSSSQVKTKPSVSII